MIWIEAKDNCAELNANLVSINSNNEKSFLQKLTASSKTRGFWAGGKLAADGASFLWTDKSKFDFENWGEHQPSGDGSCLTVQWNTLWNDLSCKTSLAYICRKSLLGT